MRATNNEHKNVVLLHFASPKIKCSVGPRGPFLRFIIGARKSRMACPTFSGSSSSEAFKAKGCGLSRSFSFTSSASSRRSWAVRT